MKMKRIYVQLFVEDNTETISRLTNLCPLDFGPNWSLDVLHLEIEGNSTLI